MKEQQLAVVGYAYCERCFRPTGELDAHEVRTRARGGSITDARNIRLVCRYPCHDWITNHPVEAEEEGWVVSAWAEEGTEYEH